MEMHKKIPPEKGGKPGIFLKIMSDIGYYVKLLTIIIYLITAKISR
jgi:hypothetical protein